MISQVFGALRLAALSIFICCGVYTFVIWGAAQAFTPGSANGHLIRNSAGTIIGSRQIAQKFTLDRYFHNRPSAVDYNAAGAGGSNLSPASPELRKRAEMLIAKYGADRNNLLPTDLATASGSGLDPDITLAAAKFQISRIARSRAVPEEQLSEMVSRSVSYPGGFLSGEPIVNVLELNIKLDKLN